MNMNDGRKIGNCRLGVLNGKVFVQINKGKFSGIDEK